MVGYCFMQQTVLSCCTYYPYVYGEPTYDLTKPRRSYNKKGKEPVKLSKASKNDTLYQYQKIGFLRHNIMVAHC